jgi:hypothetical protein
VLKRKELKKEKEREKGKRENIKQMPVEFNRWTMHR